MNAGNQILCASGVQQIRTALHRDASPLSLQDPFPGLQSQGGGVQGPVLCLLAGREYISILRRVVRHYALQRPADQGVGQGVGLEAAVQWAVLGGKHFPEVAADSPISSRSQGQEEGRLVTAQ